MFTQFGMPVGPRASTLTQTQAAAMKANIVELMQLARTSKTAKQKQDNYFAAQCERDVLIAHGMKKQDVDAIGRRPVIRYRHG